LGKKKIVNWNTAFVDITSILRVRLKSKKVLLGIG
jgi:hypothetical protein